MGDGWVMWFDFHNFVFWGFLIISAGRLSTCSASQFIWRNACKGFSVLPLAFYFRAVYLVVYSLLLFQGTLFNQSFPTFSCTFSCYTLKTRPSSWRMRRVTTHPLRWSLLGRRLKIVCRDCPNGLDPVCQSKVFLGLPHEFVKLVA